MTKFIRYSFVVALCVFGALCRARVPKIAIIGGGIGGTSSAYFLRDLFGSELTIDLYEPKEIGGRLATVTINNGTYETGGSILHPRNKYMLNFIKLLGHKKRSNAAISRFGIYDGTEFVYTESDWQVMSMLRLLWRYGYGPVRLQAYIDDQLSKFSRVYALQGNKQCYETVGELLNAMNSGFVDALTTTTRHSFTRDGFSDRMVDELIAATLTCNYGQNTSAHAFVGMVSVAGASSGLWAVDGGNKRVPQGLLAESKARLVKSQVAAVRYNPDARDYTLTLKNATVSNKTENNSSNYDVVIIATPLTEDMSNIHFVNIPGLQSKFPGNFHRTVCTIVSGKIDPSFFGVANEDEMVDELFYLNFVSFFHSLARVNPVDSASDYGKSEVWKMFSLAPISNEDLNKVFKRIDKVEVTDWLAYPHYDTSQRNDSFVLNENLYHVNAIEWAASAMEMSVIGAKNVALLAYKRWNALPLTDSAERFDEEL